MKARDIIPGWPRGKSTTQPFPVYPFEGLLTLYFYDQVEQAKDYGYRFEEEYEANRRYHEGQQAMVDRFRKLEAERKIDVWLCSAGASELLPNKRQSIENAIKNDMESALYRVWRRLTFPELL